MDDAVTVFICDDSPPQTRRSLAVHRAGVVALTAFVLASLFLLRPVSGGPPPRDAFFVFFFVALLLPLVWVLLLFFRKIIRKPDAARRLELFPEHMLIHRLWSAPQRVEYGEIADALVRYDSQFCSYDRLEILLTMKPRGTVSTGGCRCRGEVVENAAMELRRRILAAGGEAAGDSNRDRAARLGQLRSAARMELACAVILWAVLLIPFVYSLKCAYRDQRMRWLGKEMDVVVTDIVPLRRGLGLSYEYMDASGVVQRDSARYMGTRFEPAPEAGSPIRLYYDPDRPGVAYPASALPFLSWKSYVGVVLLALLTAAGTWYCNFLRTGRAMALARWKLILLRPGELEEDRLQTT